MGFGASELKKLYDPSISTSFGNFLNETNSKNQVKYKCVLIPDKIDSVLDTPSIHGPSDLAANHTHNCTAWYLAQSQWGKSLVTLNPPSENLTYFPNTKDD